MRRWIVLAMVGLFAQLVDGSLGMAYGVTSSTLLLAAGTAPAVASASVHLAEVGTTLASGAAHATLGNVDWSVVRRIALPGAVGAFAGATVLSSLSTEWAAPWMSGLLLALGIYLMIRFTFGSLARRSGRVTTRFLIPVGLVGGFVDASGGGGWGPIATPSLLAGGRMEPRKVIGSVDTSEFIVATAASVGFFFGLGTEVLDVALISALLVGGLIAAPIAAWLVRWVPARMLGAAVGGVIVMTNLRTIGIGLDVSADGRTVGYVVVAVVWIAALVVSFRRHRAEQAERAERASSGADATVEPTPAA